MSVECVECCRMLVPFSCRLVKNSSGVKTVQAERRGVYKHDDVL